MAVSVGGKQESAISISAMGMTTPLDSGFADTGAAHSLFPEAFKEGFGCLLPKETSQQQSGVHS